MPVLPVQGGRSRLLGPPSSLQPPPLPLLVTQPQLPRRRRPPVLVPAEPGLDRPGHGSGIQHLRRGDAAAEAERWQLPLQPHRPRLLLLHQRRGRALRQKSEAGRRRTLRRRHLPPAPGRRGRRRRCAPSRTVPVLSHSLRSHPGSEIQRERRPVAHVRGIRCCCRRRIDLLPPVGSPRVTGNDMDREMKFFGITKNKCGMSCCSR